MSPILANTPAHTFITKTLSLVKSCPHDEGSDISDSLFTSSSLGMGCRCTCIVVIITSLLFIYYIFLKLCFFLTLTLVQKCLACTLSLGHTYNVVPWTAFTWQRRPVEHRLLAISIICACVCMLLSFWISCTVLIFIHIFPHFLFNCILQALKLEFHHAQSG